jgi:hypothetical protein
MVDRTWMQVVIYSCPPEDVSKVLDVLEQFNLDNEYVLPDDPERDPAAPSRLPSLELGRGYIHSETPCGTSNDIRQALPEGAAWKVWEEPTYVALGEVYLNHPDLGLFKADCDHGGQPVFSSVEVDDLVELTGGDRVQMGHRTGRTWEMALEQLEAANNGIVIPRDTETASAPLQAAALNQLASGPARWLPPDAPGLARATTAPTR